MGTFLRGPNWNFFGPFEDWDPHKVDPLNNVNVSDIFWLNWLGVPLDSLKERYGAFFGCVLRELPGFVLLFIYFIVLPPVLARTFLMPFFMQHGLYSFHGAGDAAPVHGVVAHQDGAALDHELEVHRVPAGDILQLLGGEW